MYRVHITLSNVFKKFIISQVYLLRNHSKSLNHYWIILVEAKIVDFVVQYKFGAYSAGVISNDDRSV